MIRFAGAACFFLLGSLSCARTLNCGIHVHSRSRSFYKKDDPSFISRQFLPANLCFGLSRSLAIALTPFQRRVEVVSGTKRRVDGKSIGVLKLVGRVVKLVPHAVRSTVGSF